MTGENRRGIASCCHQLLSCKGALFEIFAFVLVALCASLPYSNSLDGKFAYDDKVAVVGNPDVYRKSVPLWDLITHDFWGNDMINRREYGWTHHSWRPVVVASFRMDHLRGDGGVRAFHVTNVLVHVLSALVAYGCYRLLFPAPARGRALLAGVLFALHPIHSECVANITSRADAVASLVQLACIALYVAASGRIVPALSAAARRAVAERISSGSVCSGSSGSGSGSGLRRRAASLCGWLCRAAMWGRDNSGGDSSSTSSGGCCAATRTALRLGGIGLLFVSLLLLSLACKETSLMVPFLAIVHDIALAMATAAVGVGAAASAPRAQAAFARDEVADAAAEMKAFAAAAAAHAEDAATPLLTLPADASDAEADADAHAESSDAVVSAARKNKPSRPRSILRTPGAGSPASATAASASAAEDVGATGGSPAVSPQADRHVRFGGAAAAATTEQQRGRSGSASRKQATSSSTTATQQLVGSPTAADAVAVGSSSVSSNKSSKLGKAAHKQSAGSSPAAAGPLHFVEAPPLPWPAAAAQYLRHAALRDAAWLKAALLFAFGFVVYYVRIIIVARGYTLSTWANPIHNSLYHTADTAERLMSIAMVQAWALSKLVVPVFLSHEHNALQHVTSLADGRNLLTLAAWASLAGLAALSFGLLRRGCTVPRERLQQRQGSNATAPFPANGGSGSSACTVARLSAPAAGSGSATQLHYGVAAWLPEASASSLASAYALLFGLGWVAVSYFPSSHAVQYVAFVLAERTLYLPSFGAAMVMAEVAALAFGARMPVCEETAAAAAEDAGDEASGSTAAALAAAAVNSVDRGHPHVHEEAHGHDDDGAGAGAGKAGSVHAHSQHQQPKMRTVVVAGYRIRQPVSVPTSASASPSATSSSSSSSSASTPSKRPSAAALTPQSAAAQAAGSDADAEATKRRQQHRRLRRGATVAATAALLAWYAGRTYTRNWDWVDEEALMRANMEMYPVGNVMTVYGLGAVALYKGQVDEAEALLVRACNESTMVEPHILLSQLYWKHRVHQPAYAHNASSVAVWELQRVAATVTPRKEVLTNLGLLQMRRVHSEPEPADDGSPAAAAAIAARAEALKQAEYYILAAHVAHGYPEGHSAIAQLASNAACVRLMSSTDRYGEPVAAEGLINEALAIARNGGGSGASFRNAATFYAVQGYPVHALDILAEGIGHVEEALAGAQAASPSAYHGNKATVVQYFVDMLYGLQRQQLAISTHMALISSWGTSGQLVAGKAAEPRMAALGLECVHELLWW